MLELEQLPEKAKLLRQYREAKSQKLGRPVPVREAAEAMGISASTLCNLEGGKVPDADLAHRLAAYYAEEGASLNDFWTPPTLPFQEAAEAAAN